MVGTFFVLLMYFGDPTSLKEYTIRDGLSKCLQAKRSIERNLRDGKSKRYEGSVRLQCKKLKVEHDEDYRIIRFIEE